MTNQNTTAPAAAAIPSTQPKDATTPAAEQPKTAPVDPQAVVAPAAKA